RPPSRAACRGGGSSGVPGRPLWWCRRRGSGTGGSRSPRGRAQSHSEGRGQCHHHAYALGRLRIVESLGDDAGADGELPGEIDAFTGGDIMQGQEVAPERVIPRFERACCRQEQFGSPVISHAVLPGSHAVVIVVTVAYAGTKVRPSSTP